MPQAQKPTNKIRNGLYKRGSSWYILYKLDGKQHRKSFGPGAENKLRAEAALAALNAKIKGARLSDDWSGLESLSDRLAD